MRYLIDTWSWLKKYKAPCGTLTTPVGACRKVTIIWKIYTQGYIFPIDSHTTWASDVIQLSIYVQIHKAFVGTWPLFYTSCLIRRGIVNQEKR